MPKDSQVSLALGVANPLTILLFRLAWEQACWVQGLLQDGEETPELPNQVCSCFVALTSAWPWLKPSQNCRANVSRPGH